MSVADAASVLMLVKSTSVNGGAKRNAATVRNPVPEQRTLFFMKVGSAIRSRIWQPYAFFFLAHFCTSPSPLPDFYLIY